MALTSRDETDLLLPLFAGSSEAAPFSTFLERLRRRAAATFVAILIRPAHGGELTQLFVGPDIPRRARELGLDELNLADRIQYDRLRPGRVYSGDEFDDHDPVRQARRRRDMRKLGLTDERAVRLLDDPAASAWLVLASERPCTAADSALLSALAPYAALAVRAFVAAAHGALLDAAGRDALARAGSGWLVLDKAARLLAVAPTTERLLTRTFGHAPRLGERVREFGPAAERTLAEAADAFARQPGSADRAMLLLPEPRIEALLAPASPGSNGLLGRPALIAHLRQPRASSAARAEHLARLHDLPRREAELAVLLAQGQSLAEAGARMGLTLETTRNYSKRLFAKLGVRGQADAVRLVHESCAMLG
ncbi:DNA-binding CsgD family transcriptional regulator [Novosphingobium chloroacetimidivorans]|uniref:DNA-binding CsgD family transcriptional regulator n=1 Tax=Novosphingobium chloroacetimidivorans TaxID=1428314 RepID=A0A7W7KCB1_9SPHN|nr:helix-turn-helix transcriptional regulator [Novosphingobium chloroacetimidivorans]MBB4860156.1 DNA-binding CsgD family transcriptional regulator [Novosphingobium chloroacetimidivorans]